VTHSYVANLKGGRIENPGLIKLEAIAGAMGFPPALWFGDAEEGRVPDGALLAALKNETVRSILEEAQRMRPKDKRLLLGVARQIASPPEDG
jgi:transcriptional regulator with XRE-family HTH domain